MAHYETLKSVCDLVEIAGKIPGTTVLIPGGDRVEDIRFVDAARDYGIIKRAILVGSKQQIVNNAEKLSVDIDPDDIVDIEDEQQIGEKTVELVNSGQVDIVLKGGISTPIINRAMFKLAVRHTVSLASIFDAAQICQGKPVILTDAGVTTVCNFERMVDIIKNSIEVAQVVMGIAKPKVAILSANEKQIPSLSSTTMGLELTRLQWDDAIVCGPLSFDLATDPESVAIKGMPDLPYAEQVAGDADILVCPGLDSANILYKTISSIAKYGEASIAGITMGFKVPYVILSRSDSLATRLESVALCSIYAYRRQGRQDETPVVKSNEADSEINHRVFSSAVPAAQSCWVFHISSSDCAGALTGISAAFSNENINIRAVTGHGDGPDHTGVIEVGFESCEQLKNVLVRKIKRLSKVNDVRVEKASFKNPSQLLSTQ